LLALFAPVAFEGPFIQFGYRHERNEELFTGQMRLVPFRASVATVEVRNNIGVYEEQFDD
jgi:hypothetical protein